MLDLPALHEEVLGGLGNEQARLDEAKENADFFLGEFEKYGTRPPTSAWEGARYQRRSGIMTWLVETLAANLYSSGPTRSIPDHPEASDWLNAIYKASAIDAFMQSADQWSTVNQIAAIQAIPTDDPSRPVRHALWPGQQLCVWESEEDPLKPDAIATIDLYDNRRRIKVWTVEERLTYTSEKLSPLQTSGGTAMTLVARDPNPFGILPFALIHYNFPTTNLWSGGPGTAFKDLNDYLNASLTDSGDSIRYCLKPIIKALGVRAGWRPTTPVQPGDIWDIPAEGVDVDGNGVPPDVSYLLPDTSFVESHWYDIQSYLDHGMQCAGVPTSLFRMVQTSGQSGAAIVAEQLPLVLRAEGRQRAFGSYEASLKRVTLTVGAVNLGSNGIAGSEQLRAAADDPNQSLKWPNMRPKLSGAEADASDAWKLQNRLTSRTQIVMEREKVSREEAEAYLDQVAKDLQREDALFPAPKPPPQASVSATGSADDEELTDEEL